MAKRHPNKLKKVLEQKGYPEGKAPKGKVAHHVTPVARKGKTTKNNIRVISEVKHKLIHKRRRKVGKI